MRKPTSVQKIHRFQPFSERIQSVNVDVSRKIEKRAETPEDQETFFEEGLLKWRDLNQTAHYTKFYREVQGCTQTFAQLLHNEQKVVDSLLEHLQVPASMAMEALLDLVVQLARDLQKDFYQYFDRFFPVICKILSTNSKIWETLEQAFSCLSYLFKFLWRKMINDMKKIYVLYEPFLGYDSTDYMRRFAAESVSYLMRKIKDKKQLFKVLFSTLKKEEYRDGIGNLIFEMVKGPKKFFHSCFEETFTYLFTYVGDQGSSSPQFYAVHTALQLLCDHIDLEHTQPLWNVIKKEVKAALESGNTERIDCIASYLQCAMEHKKCYLLPSNQLECSQWCNETIIPLLNALSDESFDRGTVNRALEMMRELLLSDKRSPDTATIVKCLGLIYNKKCVKQSDEIFTFTESIVKYSQFEKDVLRRYLEFCNDCLAADADSDDENRDGQLVFYSLSGVLLSKRRDRRDGVYEPFDPYPITLKTKKDRILSILTDALNSVEEHICADVNLWTAFHILPHHTSADKDKYGKLFLAAFYILVEHEELETALKTHCLQACLQTGHVPDEQIIFKILEADPGCEHHLNLVSIYLSYHKSHGTGDAIFTEDRFMSTYPLLKKNISTYNSQVRLLTLRILSMFPIDKPTTKPENQEEGEEVVERDGVFTICLKSEEQEATLSNYREKLRILRDLDYDLIHDRLPLKGMLDDVPLRYLSTMLYVNFSMMWPETITLIESHGNSLNRDKLWTCYEELLTTASENCMNTEIHETAFNEGCELHPVDEMFPAEDSSGPLANTKIDHFNHRQLMWKAIQGFSHRCEKNSKTIVSLFFQFLEKEYCIADFYDAPAENIESKETKAKRLKEARKKLKDEEDAESMDEEGSEENSDGGDADDEPEEAESVDDVEKDEEEDEEEDDEEDDSDKEDEDEEAEGMDTDESAEKLEDDEDNDAEDEAEEENAEDEEDDADDGSQDEYGMNAEERKKRTKAVYQTFITKLTLFSKFKHPLSISQEPRLHKLYNDLLLHRDITVQQVILKCLMTYKKKHLMAYNENFERLLNDGTFRTELTLFGIDTENSIVKEEDRPAVMPILLRILYGRMLHSTGKDTKGRGARSDLRRNIVLSFLAGCREEEIGILLDLITEPFSPLLQPDYVLSLDLSKASPPRRILGLLSTIVVVMEKLSHLLKSHLSRILNLLLNITRYAAFLLDEKREEINYKAINTMKVARQTAIKCIAEFMDKNTDYAYSETEVEDVYNVAVWPQLPKLAYEGTSAPTSLLTLIETWSRYQRYIPMLLKLDPVSNTEYPLSAVMKLLSSKVCKLSVGSVIMDLVENILDFHSGTTREDMQTETDNKNELIVPVGDVVEVDDSAGSYEVGMLTPHLHTIIQYIKGRVSRASLKGKSHSAFPMKELNILSVCSQYVDAPELCAALLNQLLPFLTTGSGRLSVEIQCGIIKTLASLARKTEDVNQHLCKLATLCSTLTERLSRMQLVTMFDSLKDLSTECKEVADFTRDVNAFDRSRIEEPDYDSRLGVLREIMWWDYEKCPLSLIVAMIHNMCFTIKYVDDMALRDSSSAAIQTIVKKMPEVHYDKAINGHLVPILRVGIQIRKDTVRTEFLAILRDMVSSRPELYNDMVGLSNDENLDDDFWENIRHIQVSRRLKGLNRLMRHLDKVQMKSTTLTKYLLPLVFSFIKEESDYHKKDAMLDVCIATVGALCKHLPWSAYKAQLKQAMVLLAKLHSNKMTVRLICTILDSFHYDVSLSTYTEAQVGQKITTGAGEKRQKTEAQQEIVPQNERPLERPSNVKPGPASEAMIIDLEPAEVNDDVDEGIDLDSETHDSKSVDSESVISTLVKCPPDVATSIHSHVIGSLLPQLHEILSKKATGDDLHKENKTIHPDQAEVLRIPLAVAIVTLLQKISSSTLERHLPSVLAKVCHFVKSRAEDIRDAARQTLARMLACLGVEYLYTITEHLKSTLTKGYQIPVLGYSLHYIINQNTSIIKPGDLSTSLNALVQINIAGLFGLSSQAKDVDKRDTSKEKIRPQYYELFGLLARFSSPSTIALILIPLKERLDVIHKAKDMSKLRQSLDKIADGLLQNSGLTPQQYLKFTYGLVTESLNEFFLDKRALARARAEEKRKAKEKGNLRPTDTHIVPKEPGRMQPLPPTLKKSNKHVLVEFGMKLFHMLIKKAKILHSNEEHSMMVDPFVQPMTEALNSEHIPVLIESLMCMNFLLKFRGLPAMVENMETIVNHLFVLLKTYSAGGTTGESFTLCQLCFRLVSSILKTCSYYQWTEDKIEVLLTYAENDLLDYNRQATAFSLLKAIISRKLLCKLLYEVMHKVEELSVKSESAEVRLNCRQVVLQFLLDYPLGKKLPRHITFYLDNLDYELQHGRESIYEMLGAMLTAFPQKTIHTYSSAIFISLARARVNDEAEKCRKLAALGVKTLLSRVERNIRTKLFSMTFKWLQEDKVEIVQMAAQIIGVFVEVESDGFSSRFEELLPIIEKSLQPHNYQTTEGESNEAMDLQLYHLILLVMKIIKECPRMLRQETSDNTLEHIREHMLHPHTWVRFASAQVFGLVFSTYNPDELVAALLASGQADDSMVNKNTRDMMFLLRNMRQKLRDFTADFCTQFSSKHMDEAFASQIVKNLVFLVKVIKRLPESKPQETTAADATDATADEAVDADIPVVTNEDDMDDGEGSDDDDDGDDDEDIDESEGEEGVVENGGESSSTVQVQPKQKTSLLDQELTENQTDPENQSRPVTVSWLIRRLGKIAAFEATSAPRESVKRTNVFKCLAAISVELGAESLLGQLRNILPPLHREITMVKLFPETEEMRNLANEVSTLLKNTVGVADYSTAYAAVHQAANQRKADRKRKLAQQAITNPSISASKKMKIHLKKSTGKRAAKKQSRFMGSRGRKPGRSSRLVRDLAILQ